MVQGINNTFNTQISTPVWTDYKVQQRLPEQKPDKFEKENKLSNKAKFSIGIGISAALLAGVYFLLSRRPKSTPAKTTKPHIPAPPEKPVKPPKPEEPVINSNTITPEALRAQYDECQQQLKLFKPYNNMSEDEKDKFHLWNKNVFSPLLDNIKHNNVSTVQGLHFPIDGSLEQKKNFWNNVFLRMKDSNASFFDGISLFEKFGYRDFCDDTGANSLSAIALAFPHNPDDKTICKVFDVFNKFAIFKPGDSADAISFFNILQTPGVLKNQDFIKLAFDKGKNFIWDIDSILSLKFNLLDKSDAPFKDNDFVRNVFDIAIANSHKVREPFKDNPDIFLYEAKRNILR